MPDQNEAQRRPLANDNPEGGVKPADAAVSSKRLKDKDKLDKNKGKTPAGDSRSGSDSNASRRTTGH